MVVGSITGDNPTDGGHTSDCYHGEWVGSFFWPAQLQQLDLLDGSRINGQLMKSEPTADERGLRRQYKIANRDMYGLDFRWIDEDQIVTEQIPTQLLVLERIEHGDFYGELKSLQINGQRVDGSQTQLDAALISVDKELNGLKELEEKLKEASYRMEKLRLKQLKYDYKGLAASDPERVALNTEKALLDKDFARLIDVQTSQTARTREDRALFVDAEGTEKEIILADIFQVYAPNQMATSEKMTFYAKKLGELFVGEPRESNTEGGDCFQPSSGL